MPLEASGISPTSPESREARSLFSEGDCPLNTDYASDFWRNAPIILLTRNAYGEPLAGPPTEVRSRWTRTHLYVLFSCPYETLWLKPDPVTSRETNRLWEWDVAEVFIRAEDAHLRRYKEFEVSPQGEWSTWTWTWTRRITKRDGYGLRGWRLRLTSTANAAPGAARCGFPLRRSTRDRLRLEPFCESTSSGGAF
jgi:hypothetical protein